MKLNLFPSASGILLFIWPLICSRFFNPGVAARCAKSGLTNPWLALRMPLFAWFHAALT